MLLTRKQIKEIRRKVIDRVRVSCDERHPHSALNGCVVGEEDAVTICKLCETVMNMYAGIGGVVKVLQSYEGKEGL